MTKQIAANVHDEANVHSIPTSVSAGGPAGIHSLTTLVHWLGFGLLPWSIRLRRSYNVNGPLAWLSMNAVEPSMNFALASRQALAFAIASQEWLPLHHTAVGNIDGCQHECRLH